MSKATNRLITAALCLVAVFGLLLTATAVWAVFASNSDDNPIPYLFAAAASAAVGLAMIAIPVGVLVTRRRRSRPIPAPRGLPASPDRNHTQTPRFADAFPVSTDPTEEQIPAPIDRMRWLPLGLCLAVTAGALAWAAFTIWVLGEDRIEDFVLPLVIAGGACLFAVPAVGLAISERMPSRVVSLVSTGGLMVGLWLFLQLFSSRMVERFGALVILLYGTAAIVAAMKSSDQR